MRRLRYVLELTDGSHRDESLLSYPEAEVLLFGMDWKTLSSPLSPSCLLPDAVDAARPADLNSGLDSESDFAPICPFMLFLDPEESFFMIMPEEDGLMITTNVRDKWNLLGVLERQKSFTLNFGVLCIEDSLRLLKLFFEDKYPTLRALEKAMSEHGPLGALP
jgi:hypothetical protein